MSVVEIAEQLYGLPAAEFTPARDALVREHRGDKELAAAIKALRKPSVAAWVVNQLVRRESEQAQQLLAVGAALREAAAALDAAELRELTKQRRQVTAAMTTQARRVARELGVKVTEAVATQVEQTLTAAMLDERAAEAVRSGLLVTALEPAAVDAVGEAVALPEALGFVASAVVEEAPGRPSLTVLKGEKERTEAEEELAEATAALAAATSAREAAEAAVGDLEAEELRVGAALDEARRHLADLEAEAERVEGRLGEAVEQRDEAVSDEEAAAQRRTDAQARLTALGG